MLAICAKQSGLHCSYRWGINDGHSLDHFLLVRLGAGAVAVADDRGHAGLVAHGGGEVDGLLGVILGEARQRRANWLAFDSLQTILVIFFLPSRKKTYDLTFPR